MNLKSEVPDYITYPLVAAIVGPILAALPIVGMFLLMPLIGFFELFDLIFPGDFNESGKHIDWAVGMNPKTTLAWVFVSSFFFLCGFILALLKSLAVRFGSKTPLTIACVGMFMVSWALVFVSDFLWTYQTKVRLQTPSETVFVCSKDTAIVIHADNETKADVWLEELKSYGGLSSRQLGTINYEKKSFMWPSWGLEKNDYTINQTNETLNKLRSCKNHENQAILDIYTEVVPDDFYDDGMSQYGDVTFTKPLPGEKVASIFSVSGQIPFSWLQDDYFLITVLIDEVEVMSRVASYDKSRTSAYAEYFANFNVELDLSDVGRVCKGDVSLIISSMAVTDLSESISISCSS